ncbi:MAG: zinc-binding dehydrogenase [Saprospiraceae bacterium]|nr:zinc-binding dehydrogenase [Saprospiraceae bacterium]
MKGIVLKSVGETVYENIFHEPPKPNEYQISLTHSALNHRDLWILLGKYPNIKFPSILGSDGVGYLGQDRFIINPGLHWGIDQSHQSDKFEVLGMPTNGTFATQINIPTNSLYPIPSHLSEVEAAALPLAGVTAYRSLFTRAKITSEHKVLITGIGGGVALFGFQFAKAIGCQVWVTSGQKLKLQKALELGADGGSLYNDEAAFKSMAKEVGGFDIILDSAGGSNFDLLTKQLKPGGTIVFYGAGQGPITHLTAANVFWKQLNILGSTMGSPLDFSEMLLFVEKHKIRPIVDSVFPLLDFQKAINRMQDGAQFGKIVFAH